MLSYLKAIVVNYKYPSFFIKMKTVNLRQR